MECIESLTRRDSGTIRRLLDIWRSAVQETHTFLSGDDIAALEPEVEQALLGIQGLYGYRENGELLGFLGVHGEKIEMLFVDAGARGKGIGKRLLRYALDTLHARDVDVNEQNVQGVGFYTHMGFRTAARSAVDGQGRPFPILHLTLAPDWGSQGKD